MKCPFCANEETDVIDSRDTSDFASVRRRRECPSCQKRFTTYEKMEESAIIILKKDGRREKFDKQKLTNSILKSIGKRPVSYEKIIALVDVIERDLRNRQSAEVKSTIIGEMVMKRLRKLDDIAYIRFAAVYKELKDLNDLRKELKGLEKK